MTSDDQRAQPPVPPLAGEEVAEAMLVPPTVAPVEPAHDPRSGLTPAPPNRLLPIIIGAALFMQTLDSNVVSNALPTMARALGETVVSLNIIISVYLVAAAVFLPMSGWIADRFGARSVFRAAIAGFALSSMLCGLAENLPLLVAARMLQGLAGAMMVPVGRLVLLRSVPKSEMVQAMGWLTVPALLGPILGPPIGGFIVTFLSWRWIFFINVPMGVIGVVLATLYIPDIRETVREKLDLRGFFLTACCLATLVFGFDNLGRSGMPAWSVALLLAASAISGVLYWFHCRRTPHAILDLSLLRIPTFTAGTIGGLFSRLIIGGLPFLLALLLQIGFGLSPFESGMLTFASAVGALAMKATARPIIRRFGFRTVLIGNALIVSGTTITYMFFRSDSAHWLLIFLLLANGFFRSLQFTALNAIAFADVPQERMSRASSFASMAQQVAQSIGVGIAALSLHYTMLWDHGPGRAGPITAQDITPAFGALAAISLIGLCFYVRLAKDAADEVAGRPFKAAA